MPARSFSGVPYIPLLSIRPAEMQALEQLPERDKDKMLPTFVLRPWTSAHYLESALTRLEDAYGLRPCFVDLCAPDETESRRPVHDELDELRKPSKGYNAWCEFIEENPHFIPAIQYQELKELQRQIERLYALDRGLLVPIRREAFAFVEDISDIVAKATKDAKNVCFLLDYERATKDILMRQVEIVGTVNAILKRAPSAVVSISASSFPDSFTSITNQEIYERVLFNGVVEKLPKGKLIYSDRGSARAERQSGGGSGVIPPRIDYALASRWTFFRADDAEDKQQGYEDQATLAMEDKNWDAKLRLWGTQMIERTASGDGAAITSPAKATATRINIHLHRQLFYNDPGAMYETDEEWKD